MPNAGVVVTNPQSQSPNPGLGTLNVVWDASQSGLQGQANWYVNIGAQHPISSSAPFMNGNYTVTFTPLAGYTAPAPKSCHVWSNATTKLTVTYGQP
jgi:hypothetical protein